MAPNDSRLSEEENERIFREKIVPHDLSGGVAQDRPIAYLLGGQPGSGKSKMEKALMRKLAERGGGVKIETDAFRERHPSYPDFMRDDDRSMAVHTAADAGRWTEKSIEHVAARRVDMVVAGTMRQPDVVESTANQLREAGYRVEAHILAATDAESRLGILTRYQRDRIAYGSARYTVLDVHDKGYEGVTQTADAIDAGAFVDAVHVQNRDGVEIYQNHREPSGDWAHAPGARAAIEAERARTWSTDKTEAFDNRIASVRDPDLRPGQTGEDWYSPRWRSEVDEVEALSAPYRATPLPADGASEQRPPAHERRARIIADQVAKAMADARDRPPHDPPAYPPRARGIDGADR